jgi:hypothetical protein
MKYTDLIGQKVRLDSGIVGTIKELELRDGERWIVVKERKFWRPRRYYRLASSYGRTWFFKK